MDLKTLQGHDSTRVLDGIKHKHPFIIYHILESMLYVVKTAALTVLTLPLIADISKAALIIWIFFSRAGLSGRVFILTLRPWVIKTHEKSSHLGTHTKRVPDIFFFLTRDIC